MNDSPENRVQELFLAALELPEVERDVWLVNQCGDDQQLLASVRQLLAHDNIDDDPFEKKLDEALDVPNALVSGATANELSKSDATPMDSKHFISKLSEVGVLSAEEMDALNQSIASGRSSDDPRQLASQLIKDGKLTDYQASALLKGQPELLIDKYLILDLLDAGGMGMVFKAIHRPMNRTVAVKMIAQHLLASPDQVKRFQREVRVAATLEHPNIVRSYDADRSRGVYFLVMEYVRGENLARIVQQQGPMSVELAVDCIRQAAKGLRHAQQQGVIHRDIKPGNLMLAKDGLVKVLDLGLANIDESFRLAQQRSSTGDAEGPSAQSLAGSELTSAGAVLGTVSFMAPEQSLDARTADTRADIYSLGCTLYYLLIGEAPYKGDTIFQVFTHHREGPIPKLREKRPDVPQRIEAVYHKMLAKAPEDRFQSMGQLLAAIEDCDIAPPPEVVKSEKSKASAPSEIGSTVTFPAQESRTSQQPKSGSPLGWLAALALLLAIGGGYWWWQNHANQEKTPTQLTDTDPTDHVDATSVTQPVAVATPQYGLHFDGADDFVELPLFEYPVNSPRTIELWANTPEFQSNEGAFLAKDGLLGIESGSHQNWRVVFQEGKGSFFRAASSSKQIIGNRFHIAAVLNDLSLKLFINGREESLEFKTWSFAEGTKTANQVSPFDPQYAKISSSQLGRALKIFRSLVGTIDEVRISTSARYTEDFTPVDRFEADADTLALYHFDEGEGDVLTDSSGNGHHGKIVGAQWIKVYDEANMSAADLLATGEYEWQIVEELPIPGDLTYLAGADMSADGLTLVVSAGMRPGSYGGKDLWMTTRETLNSEWSQPVNLGDQINTEHREFNPAITPDGLTVLFTRSSSGSGYHTWLSTRDSVTSPWAEPKQFRFGDYSTPDLTSDQRTVVVGTNLLAISRRSSRDAAWPSPTPIELSLSNSAKPRFGSISEDGRLLVYARVPDEGHVVSDVWIATRANWNDSWSEPKLISSAWPLPIDGQPRLLPDGKSILLTAHDHEDTSRGHIQIARLVRKLPTPIETLNDSDGPDEANLSAADLLATGEYEWQVEKLPEPINFPHAGYGDYAADMTADGLTIVFSSFRDEGSFGQSDLWETNRDSIDSPWKKPINLGHLVNSEDGEYGLTLSDDGLTVMFDRDGITYISVRESRTSPWTQAQAFQFPSGRITPTLTSDEITMCLVYKGRLAITHRASVDAPWPNPELLPETLSGNADIARGAISSDGQSLLIERLTANELNQSLGRKSSHWLSSRRDTADSDWSEPVQIDLGRLNAAYVQFLPDSKTLSFSAKPLNGKVPKIHLARLVRKPPVPKETPSVTEGEGAANLSAADLLATGEYEWRVDERLPVEIPPTSGADMSADGLTLVVSSGKTGVPGGLQDLWMVTRESADSEWSEPIKLGDQINTDAGEIHPELTPDGLGLLFSRWQRGGGTWISTRTAITEPWSDPERFPWDSDYGPSVISDQLAVVLSKDGKLLISRRASSDAPWPKAVPIDSPVDSEENETFGTVSDDGRLLLFLRMKKGELNEGERTLWVSTRADWDASWSAPVRLSFPKLKKVGHPRLMPDGKSIILTGEPHEQPPYGRGVYIVRLSRKPSPPIDEANMSAADLLATGEYQWHVVEKMPEPINSEHYESSADMTADGLTIVFGSRRPGGQGEEDLWMSTRRSRAEPWSEPVNLTALNSKQPDNHPSLSADGNILVFARRKLAEQDGPNQAIMISRRKSPESPWSPPVRLNDFAVNENLPDITADALTVLVSRSNDLWISRRASVDSEWGESVRLDASINTSDLEVGGAISDDGRLLVFQRRPPRPDDTRSSRGESSLWISSRGDWDASWSEPVELTGLNESSRSYLQHPRLLPDGKTLLYSANHFSDETRNQNGFDFYLARLVRKDAPIEPRKGLEEEQNEKSTPKVTVPPAELPPPPPIPSSDD